MSVAAAKTGDLIKKENIIYVNSKLHRRLLQKKYGVKRPTRII